MGQSKWRWFLAFSAILALGSVPGWTKPAPPDRPLPPRTQERVSGEKDRETTESRAAEAAEGGRKGESEAQDKGGEPLKPARPEAEEEAPAREENSDCDDCVIVLPEADAEGPSDRSAEASGMSGPGQLAGTLWGLFMVARPRRTPRAIIRGVNVP